MATVYPPRSLPRWPSPQPSCSTERSIVTPPILASSDENCLRRSDANTTVQHFKARPVADDGQESNRDPTEARVARPESADTAEFTQIG